MVKNLPASEKMWFRSLGLEDALEKKMATRTHQCSCLENPVDRGSWWAVVPGVSKELDAI